MSLSAVLMGRHLEGMKSENPVRPPELGWRVKYVKSPDSPDRCHRGCCCRRMLRYGSRDVPQSKVKDPHGRNPTVLKD